MPRFNLRPVCIVLAIVIVARCAPGQTTATASVKSILVWSSGKMPGPATTQPEVDRPARGNAVHQITNVSRPELMVFPAPGTDKPAPAMIVSPGGAYSILAIDLEGTEIAQWLNRNGISAVVLKYRVPRNRDGALQDIQRAISLTRARAGEWNIDPQRLGVIGFSAGGNLSAKASTQFAQRSYAPIDEIDQQSCRPDFAVLVYPAYLDANGKVAPDLNLKADIPPTLILHSEDDRQFVPGSKLYDAALTAAKIPHEFILYPTGGHGYGLHCTKDAKAWPDAALAWLAKIGVRPVPAAP
jgi:acetyl esterase/lipase